MRDTNKINELHTAALKESAKTAVELIRVIHSTDSDQLLDEDIPEMGKYDQGDYPIGCLGKRFFSICLPQSAFATGWHTQDHKIVSSGF